MKIPLYSGCDPGSNTFFKISLKPGKTYWWSVKAIDSQGNESPASEWASFTTAALYKVSGKVTSGGVGLAGVTVTLDGVGATATDPGGNYQFIDVLQGTYNISFSKTGYIFNPPQETITFAEADFVLNKEATVPPISLNDGLVAYYPFNGNANDESGNGNHGIVNGATLTTDRFGNAGSAYYFDGNDGIIVNTGGNLDGFNSMTISVWVKPENSLWGGILSKGEYNGISHWTYELLRYPSGEIYASVYPNDGTGAGRIEVGNTDKIANSIWNHVTCVWDPSGYIKIYINGTLVEHVTSGVPTQMASTNYPLYIGRRLDIPYTENTAWFNGSIDDIRIYNRALSSSEIEELYNQSNSLNPGGIIKLPKTGQTRCWNGSGSEIACAGTGQDGDIQAGVVWPDPRFTPGTGTEADCMIDNLTGLMWAKNANYFNGAKNWDDAIESASNLTLCGHSDWRLPNINELESLTNAGAPDNAAWLVLKGFTSVQPNFYYSSTTEAKWTFCAKAVNMWDSAVTYDYRGKTAGYNYVWPVRGVSGGSSGPSAIWKTGQTTSYRTGDDGDLQMGVAWPDPRFTSGTSTQAECVTDNLTGLMWPKNANYFNSAKIWNEAINSASNLTLCGHSDWRLPNKKELRSLINYSNYEPALDAGHPFTNVVDYAWSSTSSIYDTTKAWIVNLAAGQSARDSLKNDALQVWPVRGGQ